LGPYRPSPTHFILFIFYFFLSFCVFFLFFKKKIVIFQRIFLPHLD